MKHAHTTITFRKVFFKPLDIFTLYCFYFPQGILMLPSVQAPRVWLTERLCLQMQGTLSSEWSKLCLNEALHIFPSFSKKLEDIPKCLFFYRNNLHLGLSRQASAENCVKAALTLFLRFKIYPPIMIFTSSTCFFYKMYTFPIFKCRGFS